MSWAMDSESGALHQLKCTQPVQDEYTKMSSSLRKNIARDNNAFEQYMVGEPKSIYTAKVTNIATLQNYASIFAGDPDKMDRRRSSIE